MNKNRSLSGLWITVSGIILFLLIFYGKIILAPNDFMFSESGDGIKNYFTYAWHIKHDTSFLNFEGMNYPYGEHTFYTDGHPVIAGFLKLLSRLFPAIMEYSIGILNFFMVVSFLLTAVFLYFIFREFRARNVLSALGALGITLLAPQVFRMGGHYSLSYGFFIPLTILLTLYSFRKEYRLKWIILQSANIIFWFYIHTYLGMMAGSFTGAWLLISIAGHFRKGISNRLNYLRLLLWNVLPVALFLLLVQFTDDHTGRTTNPSGFFLHNAEPDDILVPIYPPLRPVIDSVVKVKQNWEAWSYIGLASVVVMIVLLYQAVRRFFRERKLSVDPGLLPTGGLRNLLGASLLLLIFAFGFPFKSFPQLLDWLPWVKQFRSTGRFAWFFFFSMNIITVVFLDRLINASGKNRVAIYLLVFTGLVFNLAEGIPYHLENRRMITRYENVFRERFPRTEHTEVSGSIDFSAYQAIFPIPFFNLGSENFTLPDRGNSLKNSMVISYHTGLPVMASYLARTSVPESKSLVRMISPDWYPQLLARDKLSGKPFLLVRSPGPLSEYESRILDKALFIGDNGTVACFALPVDSLYLNSAKRQLDRFSGIRDSLATKDGFLSTKEDAFIYFNDFEENREEMNFRGRGSFCGAKQDHITLAEFGPGTFKPGQAYCVSVWMFNGRQDALNFWFRFRVEQFDPATGQWFVTHTLPEQSQVINGDWSLVEIEFTVRSPQNHIYLTTIGKKIDHEVFVMDDLLVREKECDIFRVEQEVNGEILELFKNNHRIRIPD